MKFIQITDLHIPPVGEHPEDLDIRGNFLNLLAKVQQFDPSFIVLTGDLCYKDGQAAIYQWIKTQMDATQIPYYVIPGNHDDSTLLAEHFQLKDHLKEGHLYFEQQMDQGPPLLFLDTARKVLSDGQLDWLSTKLQTYQGPLILFIHHPVLKAGTPFMDTTHALENKEAIVALLQQHPYPVYLFSGHFHIDKTIMNKNIVQHITPSCFLQISQWTSQFQVDHYRIGFREITIDADTVMSTVVYV